MFDRLIEVLVDFIKFFQFAITIRAWEQGVRLTFGRFSKVLNPGIHFYVPFFQDIITENVVLETRRVKPQSLTTKDGKTVVLAIVVTFRIEDIKTFLLDVEGRNNVIEDCAYGSVATYIMKHTWQELVELESLDNELTKAVRRQAKKYGVDIIAVQLADFTVAKSLRLITSHSSAQPSTPTNVL